MKAPTPNLAADASPCGTPDAGEDPSNSASPSDPRHGVASTESWPPLAAAAPALLEACRKMLKLTGGSQYWTGDTQEALEYMEVAVAAAEELRFEPSLRFGVPASAGEPWPEVCSVGTPNPRGSGVPPAGASSRTDSDPAQHPLGGRDTPPGGSSALSPGAASAVLPEILSCAPLSVEHGLQMAGIEAERWRK